MTVQVAPGDAEATLAILRAAGEDARVIGRVQAGSRGVVIE